MIELDGISVSLPARSPRAKTILDRVSLAIRDGEWIAVTGPNGSGKSTLLAAIAGVCPVSSGRARTDGRVGLLLQEPDNQFLSSSVRNELLLSMDASIDGRVRDERFSDAVERFALSAFLDRNPHRISGGEKQRLALATVWLADPRVVLLDEPVVVSRSGREREVRRFRSRSSPPRCHRRLGDTRGRRSPRGGPRRLSRTRPCSLRRSGQRVRSGSAGKRVRHHRAG